MRETGELRKVLSGEEAAPYVGFARTVLGQLKNQMGLSGIAQGKVTKTLPDGTVVVATSIFGLDKITISKPAAAEHEQSQEQHENVQEPVVEVPAFTPPSDDLSIPNFVAAGHVGLRAFAWVSPDRPVDLGFLPGATQNVVYDISENGQVVVGRGMVGGVPHAWAWTRAGGMVDLGARLIATSVNRDGSVIVGRGDGANDKVWVWTKPAGVVAIADAASDPKVSPNGEYITALSAGHIAAVWERRSLKRTNIPGPGTASHTPGYVPDSTLVADWNIPQNVSSRGLVTGRTSHQDVSIYYVADTFWDQGGGVPGGTTSGVEGTRSAHYQGLAPNPTPVFTFDVVAGTYSVLGGFGDAVAAADERFTVIGNEQHATTADIITMGNEVPPAALSRVALYGILTSPNVTHGWYWTPRGGKRSLGPNVRGYDISEDAGVVVGSQIVGDMTVPVYWLAGGGPLRFAVPGYAIGNGAATCVAAWKIEVSTAQQ